jgi:hypothetical protein
VQTDKDQEHRTHNGVFLGTVGGTSEERACLANVLQDFYHQLAHSLSRPGVYADVNLSLRIVDGKLHQADVNRENHYKPVAKKDTK